MGTVLFSKGLSGRASTRPNIHTQVVDELAERIVRGDLKPGDVLPNENDLGAQLNVSRTALREAIKTLAAKGLIEARPKTGTRVRPQVHWNMLDPDVLSWIFATGPFEDYADGLFEIRFIFEPEAAALAAGKCTKSALAEIDRAFRDMEIAGEDLEAGVEPDLRFHQSILKATENKFLVSLGALIESALAASFRLSSSYPGAKSNSLPLHKAVLDAIRAGNADKARKAMRILLTSAVDDIKRVVADGSRKKTKRSRSA